MGNLAKDTAVTRTGDDMFLGDLAQDWSVWGPHGGYIAAVALRAAGEYTQMQRPASIHCQFLRIGQWGPIEITVETLVKSRQAESLQVRLRQRNRLVAVATIWAIDEHPYAHSAVWHRPPDVPPPEELRRIDDMVAEEGGPILPMWKTCTEIRCAPWGDLDRTAGEPHLFGWLRFHEPVDFHRDPWLAAGRSAFCADTVVFPAIGMGFDRKDMTFIAPNLDLYVTFHAETCESEWVLIEGDGLAAKAGLLAGKARIWNPEEGTLAASSEQQMLIRQSVTVPRR